MSESYKPPYTVSDHAIEWVAVIGERLGQISLNETVNSNLMLRRDNQIKTIHASLAIENNSLSLEQVTDVINGRPVLGLPTEIQEVKNAFEAYKMMPSLNPFSVSDLLKTHAALMRGLVKDAGIFRSGGVGIFTGDQLVHMAPPAERVPELMSDLIIWAKTAKVHPLIKSCVFHYEFEFIHPFQDGNGRMGRLWQSLLLFQWKQVFAWLPVETLIKEDQTKYYQALKMADKAADSGVFIDYMLERLADAFAKLIATEQVGEQVTEQVDKLLLLLGSDTLSTREMMQRVGLSHRPTFRDNYLLPALHAGLIEMLYPDRPNSSKQKYKRVNNR